VSAAGVDSIDGPVGMVGTGQLGRVLSRRLVAAGHDVAAYDVDPVALDRLDQRVKRCDSPAAVAASARVVITCVTGPRDVLDCVLGAGGVLEAANEATLVIETTTSTPAVTGQVGERLGAVGAAIVDAPVSRGIPAAEQGTLSVWMGGADRDVERALPYLAPLATEVLHVGPLGCGHAIKAVNMMLMGVNLLATAEVMSIAHANGITTEAMLAVLNASSGGTYMSGNHFPKYVATGSYDSGFTLQLMRKDLRIARDLAEESELPALFLQRALGVYDLCLARDRDGPAEADNMTIVPLLWGLMEGATDDGASES